MFTAKIIDAIHRLSEIVKSGRSVIVVPFVKNVVDELRANGATTPKILCIKYMSRYGLDNKLIAYACNVTQVYVRYIKGGKHVAEFTKTTAE